MNRIKKYLLNPITIAISIFIVIVILLPEFKKYRIEPLTNLGRRQFVDYLYYDLKSKGKIAEIDNNLSIRLTMASDGLIYNSYYELDLDNDGETEYLFLGHNNQSIIITRNNFSHPTTINLPNIEKDQEVSIDYSFKELPQIIIHYGDYELYYNYQRITTYPYRFIILGVIFIINFVIILFIFRVINLIRNGNNRAQKTIAELKLKTIQNRLDPHFTLNVLNSIGYTFQSNDADTADYIFGKYSKLLRSTIFASNKIYTDLGTELDYISDYLDIEKFRMDDRFSYEINAENHDFKELSIPKMMIHTFVENAIKHGIKPLKIPGFLSIDVIAANSSIIIQIQDNGVGRKISNKNNDGSNTGQGLNIIDEMISLFHQLKGIKIKYEIIDLYANDNKPSGTLIKVLYPLK